MVFLGVLAVVGIFLGLSSGTRTSESCGLKGGFAEDIQKAVLG